MRREKKGEGSGGRERKERGSYKYNALTDYLGIGSIPTA
jgi:stalled ribosome alternative rescue factor ArfA